MKFFRFVNNNKGFSFFSLALFIIVLEISLLAVNEIYSSNVERELQEEFIHRLLAVKKAINSYYKDYGKNPDFLKRLVSNEKGFYYARPKDIIDPVTEKDWEYRPNDYIKSTSEKKSFVKLRYSSFAYLKFDEKRKVWVYEKKKPDIAEPDGNVR